jgi:hypothetical protein
MPAVPLPVRSPVRDRDPLLVYGLALPLDRDPSLLYPMLLKHDRDLSLLYRQRQGLLANAERLDGDREAL